MLKRLLVALAAAAILVAGAAIAAAIQPGSAVGQEAEADDPGGGQRFKGDFGDGGFGQHREPPLEVKKMLKEIDPANIEASIAKLVSFGTRNTLSSQTDPNRGIGAARDWLFSEFERYAADSGGRLTVELQSYVQGVSTGIPTPTVITNVVATLHGTQAESANRYYVVSGHYDSRCGQTSNPTCDAPGANDDASGVAAVLEMARVMSKRSFDANIVFMAVAGEEQNLYGSRFHATQARAAGRDIQGMFTNDIVGSSVGGSGIRDPYTVRLFAEGVPTNETTSEANTRRSVGGENDSPARQLARFVKEHAENGSTRMNVEMIYRRDRFNRGGDHIPFLEQGYRSAARFTEPNEDFNHQHQDVRVEDGVQIGDLIEFVDFDYTARVAGVNVAALAALANGPSMPANVRITSNLSYDTDLRWNPNVDPDLAGYEVVWRTTTEPEWTHTIPVGNPELIGGLVRVTLENMSKDNFFFGVRAVDKDGNRSPVVFPRP
jgi:peptidase M28-like protein